MHWNIAAQMVDEPEATAIIGIALRTVGGVHQLCDGHDGETDIDLSLRSLDLFEDLPDSVTTLLGGSHDTGIENQSRAGGFHGLRLLIISSTSAAQASFSRLNNRHAGWVHVLHRKQDDAGQVTRHVSLVD
jgi:hypothetical protein